MKNYMQVKFTSIYKGFLAMSALIWFFPCMNHYMLVNNTIFYKRILTMTSLIWFLPSMSPHMSYKVNYFDNLYSALNHKNIGSERLTERSEQLLKEIHSTSIMISWQNGLVNKNYN